jgi:hypothetical protein
VKWFNQHSYFTAGPLRPGATPGHT